MLYSELKEYQQNNFVILRDYLKARFGDKREDDSFRMGDCAADGDGIVVKPCDTVECGAVCCPLGLAVLAGCKPLNHGSGANWQDYSGDAFGLNDTRSAWSFLFCARWPSDIQEAVARIDMYIGGYDPADDQWRYSSRYAQ